MASYYIGLDNGGSVIKAGLFAEEGREIAISQAPIEPLLSKPGYVERDANEAYATNTKCIREVIEKAGINPKEVAALSVTGYGNGIVLVGSDGMPVYPAVVSTDTRASEYVKRWYADGTYEKVLPMISQTIWPGQIGPLIAWFADRQPDIIRKARYAFSCTDYIRFRLTGEAFGEMSNMTAASLMDLRARSYNDDLLEALGIRAYRGLLPTLRYSSEVCGRVTKEAALLTGLPEGTPVAGGMVDFAACPIATGVIDEGQISTVAGTWSINSFVAKEPIADRDLFMCSLYPVEGYYQITEGSMTSASNLEWFVRRFMKEEKKEAGLHGESVYQECEKLVSQIGPEMMPVFFLPFLYGTNVNADAKACFLGLNYMHDKAHMLRAVYEGIVFSTMFHVEKLMKYKKTPVESIRISGGAANSRFWVQMFADMLGYPVEASAAKELGTMGAAICAAVSAGAYRSFADAADHFVKIAYTCEPDRKAGEVYAKKYSQYKNIVNKMDEVWGIWNSDDYA